MSARGFARAALLAAVLFALAGCGVGYWIAGAPPRAEREAQARTAHAPRASVGGAALLARRCANCHETPDPASMSAAAWLAALERMKVRLRLPDAEWDSLAPMARRR